MVGMRAVVVKEAGADFEVEEREVPGPGSTRRWCGCMRAVFVTVTCWLRRVAIRGWRTRWFPGTR